MATIRFDEGRRLEFVQLYGSWAESQRPRAVHLYPPETAGPPGQLTWVNVPDGFVEHLREQRVPFTLVEE